MNTRFVTSLELKDIPKESKIFCEVSDGSTFVTFNHLDGMYSYCTTEKGDIVHLSRFTPLEKVEGGFKLKEEGEI